MTIKKMRSFAAAVAAVLILAAVLGGPAGADEHPITVFAAASTTNAVTDIAALYETDHPVKLRLSFASSSTLAKQIENGAPADIFLSANPKWMDYLAEKDMIVTETRRDMLGNRLVLIVPMDSPNDGLQVDASLDLAGLLGDGRLSMGDPDHVPAGMYGKNAMTHLGLWDAIADRLARAKDVRAALVLVERGECPLGQVYATDAAISAKVRVAGVFPEDSHPPIVYPAALVKQGLDVQANPGAEALSFLDFLQSGPAARVFEAYGFTVR
ncbi:molybdate ABC transporter substrate-binding protein [Desulfotignum phosphitoxidans]|uniref:Molybdate-binding periplasmic protein ModA n=1 Tax=Desulfotignum phosphitoxidans DSM 13687 TaxID=1286635 RepID=S0G361_9BACT|nr:molybdate ABC transporter substrate-binding protein [Desulfotignum phosphitoxidans]EMS78176.1 molybdate-binding periplasmic protein ModA [Desulfotignum phosphitoxidans DSM 13687]